ncbi:MAG: branched-chain amino acid transaminase [Candidatus Auribacter fodinae]|jgi:branched-chain amino acid aminotransferase|uniref:Branched-chain-amino-acid aminotransferase n=1 Tax=Candidatus Auribacter fodinae TaxID=2093366 RepID=A0A3A4R3H2_9BACT|nr:MAG: branched-chain amino acid transaminase [Candidatus Auribacter fodinae]
MAFYADKIWYDGKFVPWNDAQVHILAHSIHYGTCAFDSVRCYKTPKGSVLLRMRDHLKRLYDSCKIYYMDIPYTIEELETALIELIRINKLEEAYVRPFAFRGFGTLGLNPFASPMHVALAAWDWGKYLGEEAMEKGISVQVSSWHRAAPNTTPTLAKVAANYMNSQLIKMEAVKNGYDEGIALDSFGYVSEGSGENIFIVRNGTIYTPPTTSAILPGITRHCVFMLARDLDIRIEKHILPRESLYIADEVFLTGTAAEITPVTKVDDIIVADGKRGPITKRIQDRFFSIVNGSYEDKHNWLTYL